MDENLDRIVRAVAELDTFAEGPNDDLYCPFLCDWSQYSNPQHNEDCPISLARALLARSEAKAK